MIGVFLLLAVLGVGTASGIGGTRSVTVSVEGEVRRPGGYTLPRGARLSTLVLAAGGYSDNADLAGATVARESVGEAQRKELRDILLRLREARGESPGGGDAWRDFLDRIGALSPLGRFPAPLSHPRLLKGTPRDIPLEEGDALRIPSRRETVTVKGDVGQPGVVFPFSGTAGADEYIRRAGGTTGMADRGHAYLLRPDGTAVPLRRGLLAWNEKASRWEIAPLTGGSPAVGPGDTIFVPRMPAAGSRPASVRNLQALLMRVVEITGVTPEIP